jgi:hypothetical protein
MDLDIRREAFTAIRPDYASWQAHAVSHIVQGCELLIYALNLFAFAFNIHPLPGT